MTYVDWIVFAIVVLSAGLAWMRGFIRELLSVASWVIAAVATFVGLPKLLPIARVQVNQFFGVPDTSAEYDLLASIATGVVIFVVTLILCSIVAHFLSKRVQGSMLGPVDRSLGLLFGVARGALIVCAIALVVKFFVDPEPPPAAIANAMTYPMANKGAEFLLSLIPASLRGKADESVGEAQQQGQLVIDVGQAAGLLPEQLMPAPTAVPAIESTGSPENSGYKDAERTDLNRLIQGSQ